MSFLCLLFAALFLPVALASRVVEVEAPSLDGWSMCPPFQVDNGTSVLSALETLRTISDPLPEFVSVLGAEKVEQIPGGDARADSCPVICVAPSQQMVVKVVRIKKGSKDHQKEFTFLEKMAAEVAISPYPFFSVEPAPRGDNNVRDHFVFMEHIRGTGLDGVWKVGPRPQEAVLRLLVAQMLHQVTLLHERHIVHRDLKPEQWILAPKDCAGWARAGDATSVKNFVTNLCRLVLLDYDFACTSGSPPFKCNEDRCGTRSFAAPEMFDEKANTKTPTVDIWSLAASIVALGKQETRSGWSSLFRSWNSKFTWPAPLDTILADMLKVPPRDRPQAKELFQRYTYEDTLLADLLGLRSDAGAGKPWAVQTPPRNLEHAMQTLQGLGVASVGPQNAYQLYAALVERHHYNSRSPAPQWVKKYGEELQRLKTMDKTAPPPSWYHYTSSAEGDQRRLMAAEDAMNGIGFFPLRTMILSGYGAQGQNYNGVLPVVKVTLGPYPVVIKKAQHAKAVQIFASEAASGPLPYFSVVKSSEEFFFLEYTLGTPLQALTSRPWQPPSTDKQWEVAKLIVAQILLQLTRLQKAGLAHRDLRLEHWQLATIKADRKCIQFYQAGHVSEFVKHWCQVILVGFDNACSLGPAQPPGSRAASRAANRADSSAALVDIPSCPPRQFVTELPWQSEDVRSFGEAIVKLFGARQYTKEEMNNGAWRHDSWPAPILGTLQSILSQGRDLPPFSRLFEEYNYVYDRDAEDDGNLLAVMLELSDPPKKAGSGGCASCFGATGRKTKQWLSAEVPEAIAKAARENIFKQTPVQRSPASSVKAYQMYAVLVDKRYDAARKPLPTWSEELRMKL